MTHQELLEARIARMIRAQPDTQSIEGSEELAARILRVIQESSSDVRTMDGGS